MITGQQHLPFREYPLVSAASGPAPLAGVLLDACVRVPSADYRVVCTGMSHGEGKSSVTLVVSLDGAARYTCYAEHIFTEPDDQHLVSGIAYGVGETDRYRLPFHILLGRRTGEGGRYSAVSVDDAPALALSCLRWGTGVAPAYVVVGDVPLGGDIRIRGSGVDLEQSGNDVRLSLSREQRAMLAGPCNIPCRNTPVYSISGVPPDVDGRITIVFKGERDV